MVCTGCGEGRGRAMAAAVVKRQSAISSWILLRLMNVAFSSFSFDGSLRLPRSDILWLLPLLHFPSEFRIYRRPFGSLPEVGGLIALLSLIT